jgi:hypothetical protein
LTVFEDKEGAPMPDGGMMDVNATLSLSPAQGGARAARMLTIDMDKLIESRSCPRLEAAKDQRIIWA